MDLTNVIEYIGTPIGLAVVLAYGMKKMYEHFNEQLNHKDAIIQSKDELINQMNKDYTNQISDMIQNNVEINTKINETIKHFKDVIEK